MNFSAKPVSRLIEWLAQLLGLEMDLRGSGTFSTLNEQDISEQLHYGRG